MTLLSGDFAADPAHCDLNLQSGAGAGARAIERAIERASTRAAGVGQAGAADAPLAQAALAAPAAAAPALAAKAERHSEPSEDAALYLRHVEGGETIRALAREAGCHASTILRRIRRIEARRDDPLIDGALTREGAAHGAGLADGTHPQGTRHDGGRAAGRDPEGDEMRRILRRLAESGAQMAVASGLEKAIVTRGDIRTAILGRPLAERLALNGWVVQIGEGRVVRYQISSLGRDALRQMLTGQQRPAPMPRAADLASASPVGNPARTDSHGAEGMAEAAAPFDHAARHPRLGDAVITDPHDARPRRVRMNLSESPLLVLARRRERDGRTFLTPEMVAAGERLREDFELAQMGPRVAQNWDRFLTSGIDVSRNASAGHGGGSENARNRVAAALRDLGPGMGDMVLRVCCFLEGVEATEQRLGWSARSGKIVLRLALMRLDRHYRDTYGPGAPMIG